MRVTSNSYSENLITHLQLLGRRQSTLQTQIASGQRVKDASDDPLAAQQILTLRDDSVANAQYTKNIQVHQEFATVTNSALQSLQKVLSRAQDIAASADGIDSPGDLKSYGLEVGELIKQAIGIGNNQYRGDYIFSGTKANEPAVTATYASDGSVASVEFGGNSKQAESEIGPDVLVSSRIVASNDSGEGELGLFADARSGADLFKHLITLRDQLLAGDTKAIAAQTRADLGKDEENVLYHLAGNGALQSRLDTMSKLNGQQKLSLESDLSRNADMDLSEAVVRLSQQQTAYQATLQSAGSVLNMSLLDYLR